MTMPVQPIKKILVINRRHIGDVVMASAAMQSLRAACPDAQIDLVVPPACVPIVSYPGVVDHVFSRRHAGKMEWLQKRLEAFRWRAEGYDVCFFFGESFRNARRIAKFSNIPVRVCASHDLSGEVNRTASFCTHVVPTGSVWSTHVVKWYESIVAGIYGALDSFGLAVSIPADTDISRYDSFFRRSGKKIALCFTCSPSGFSSWPESSCIALIQRLAADGNSLIMCVGPGADKVQAERLKQLSGTDICIAETSLSECAAVMKKLDLLVSVDTGLVHVAAGVGLPVLSLAGASTAGTCPWSETGFSIATSAGCFDCRFIDSCPSNRKRRRNHQPGYVPPCMEALSVDTVYEYVQKMLENPRQQQHYRIVER